jgi:ribonuclease G
MAKELYVSSSPHETKVAVLEDDQLVEVYYERESDTGLVGSIYKGRVSRVLPGMQSAFVNVGLERDAFLYVSDFVEDEEEYDKIFTEAEARATRFVETGQAAPAEAAPAPPPPVVVAPVPALQPLRAEPTETPAAAVPAPPAAPESGEALPPPPATSSSLSSSAPPPLPTGDSREFRHYDPRRGRRGRRRGGRDFRFVPKPAPGPAPQDRPAPTEHTFEILPGESLAKYRDGAVSSTSSGNHDAAAEPAAAEPPSEPTSENSEARAEAEMEPTSPPTAEAVAPDVAPAEAVASEAPGAPPEQVAPVVETPQEAPAPESTPALEPPIAPPAVAVPTVLKDESTAIFSPGFILRALGFKSQPQPAAEPAVQAPAESAPVPTRAEGAEPPVAERAMSSSEPTEAVLPAEEEAPDEEEMEAGADEEGEGEPELAEAGEPSTEQATTPPSVETPGAPEEKRYTLREPHQRPRFAPRHRRGRRGVGGGRRPERLEPSRPGNNQPVQISDLLREGQEIIVQVAKEPLGTKGARITSHVALPGRYLVYMPTITHIGVSRKIASEEERFRLRNIILENRGSLTGGFIVRTAGAGRSEEEFKADLKFLATLWNDIRAKAERVKAPALLHRDLTLLQRILRDILSPDFKQVRVDSESEYERCVEFVAQCQPSLVGHVKLYTRRTPLFEEFGIQQEVDKALRPKVWLKSGGYIVVNQTEALVAIDVNTGKYVGKTNRLEDTIVKTNVDAVNEIVRQIRLRDLGGIIVIDFIDMDERKNRQKVVQALEEALRRDRAPTKVLSFNDFGLVAVTRKRVKQSLERTLSQQCSYCSGSGWVKSVTTVCYEILDEVKKMAQNLEGDSITLRVHPDVAHAFKSRQSALLSEIEALTHKDVIIKGDASVHQERFEIY